MATGEKALQGPIEPHSVHSKRLIEHAEEQLAKGDRLQASEKAWGAVAHQVKVIASKRGWKYDTHDQFFKAAAKIAKETDDPEMTDTLFDVAHGLHKNYYADSIPLSRLKGQLGRTKKLLGILNRPTLLNPKPARNGKARSTSSKPIGS